MISQDHKKAMVWLWGQFGKFYGGKAQRAFGDIGGDTFLIWQDVLRYFSFEQIKTGLKATVLRVDTWPPELQEFVRLCDVHGPKKIHRAYKALKAEKSAAEFARPWREKLRQQVGLG